MPVGRGDPFIRFAEIRTSFCLELFLSHLKILQFGIVCHSTLSMLRWLTRVPGRVDWRKVIGEKNPSIKAFVHRSGEWPAWALGSRTIYARRTCGRHVRRGC